MGACRTYYKICRAAVLCCVTIAAISAAVSATIHTTACPTNIVIDGTFQGCTVPRTTFTVPAEKQQFVIRPSRGTALRFTLRSSSGAARLELGMLNSTYVEPVTEDTMHGAATVVLTSTNLFDGSSKVPEWSMVVHNMYGMTTWWLQVEAFPSSAQLQANNRQQLKAWFTECCDPKDPTMSAACGILSDWSSDSKDSSTDACQSSFASCSATGELVEVVLPGYELNGQAVQPMPLTSFTAQCQSQPPAGLAMLKSLRVLDLAGHGLNWTISDVLDLVRRLPALEQLDLGSNSITGKLDETACGLFEGKLATLSFRNNLQQSSFYNRISGAVHPCVFSKRLEVLNLQGNQISSLPAIPEGSPLRSLRVANQKDKVTGSLTLTGPIPTSLARAKQLVVLDMSDNLLTGVIPALPPSLQVLDLSDNDLQGDFPVLFGSLEHLILLNLQENAKFSPALHNSGLSNLTRISTILAGNTAITGDLSSVDWSRLEFLSVLQLSNTNVSGILPPALATRPQLQLLDLSNNRGITSQSEFARTIPSANKINVYVLRNCGLTDLPEGLLNLAVFQSKSEFKNALWAGWGKVFDVSGNQITGMPIPDWLFTPFPAANFFMNGEAFLGIQGNRPSSRIPAEWDNSMTCPTQGFIPTQLQTSKQIFGVSSTKVADVRVEGTEYATGSNFELYCLDASGKAVFIGETLKLGHPVTSGTPATAPSGTLTTVKPVVASDSSQSTARVTSFGEDQPRLSHEAIIGVVVVAILVALALLGGAVYGMCHHLNHRQVRPFAEFSDEGQHPANHVVQLMGEKVKVAQVVPDVAKLQV